MEMENEFFSKLNANKIKMNGGNPVKMSVFLSFLTIPIERVKSGFWSGNGWTHLTNKESKLEIKGGIVKGVEFLNTLEFGEKLNNPYNNYVNPFYLWGILNEDGKAFFLDYYKEDIENALQEQKDKIFNLGKSLLAEKGNLDKMLSDINTYKQ